VYDTPFVGASGCRAGRRGPPAAEVRAAERCRLRRGVGSPESPAPAEAAGDGGVRRRVGWAAIRFRRGVGSPESPAPAEAAGDGGVRRRVGWAAIRAAFGDSRG